jgi:5'-3' exonuclease
MKKQRVLIIDGDLVAYRSAAAIEKRTIIAKHLASGRTKDFNTRTELKELLKSKGMEYNKDDYEITDIQTPEDISHALYIIKNLVKSLENISNSERTEICIGSGETFRHRLALPSPYKDNRQGTRPVHLQAARDYLMKNYTCSYIKDIETDDAITIKAYEEKSKGNTPILASLDKDAQGTQGITVLNWMKDSEFEALEEIPLVGSLWKDKTDIKGNGLKFIAFQVLAGDKADTYQGYELSKLPYGPTKALKALESAQTEQEVLAVVIDQFKLLYPSEFTYTDCHGMECQATWKDMLEMYWKCAYMKRSWDDESNFWEFAKERGITNE